MAVILKPSRLMIAAPFAQCQTDIQPQSMKLAISTPKHDRRAITTALNNQTQINSLSYRKALWYIDLIGAQHI